MTKLNLLEGARIKSFKYVRPSIEDMVLFLYFASLQEPDHRNILKNELLPLLFIPVEDIQERLKKLSLKGYIHMTYNGVDLNIEKRHVIGHNLSVADEAYADTMSREKPGTTVEILAEEISEFAETVKKIIVELEQLM